MATTRPLAATGSATLAKAVSTVRTTVALARRSAATAPAAMGKPATPAAWTVERARPAAAMASAYLIVLRVDGLMVFVVICYNL